MENGQTDKQSEQRDGDNGDDPQDTPRPKVYGEELEANNCEPDFIVSPPPECRTQKFEVPAFSGPVGPAYW